VTEKGNYTELDAAHIIRQILQGVQYLHSHGEYLQMVSGPQNREVLKSRCDPKQQAAVHL